MGKRHKESEISLVAKVPERPGWGTPEPEQEPTLEGKMRGTEANVDTGK